MAIKDEIISVLIQETLKSIIRIYVNRMEEARRAKVKLYEKLEEEYFTLDTERSQKIRHGENVGEINERINDIKQQMDNVWKRSKIDFKNIRDEAIKKIYEAKDKIKAKHGVYVGLAALTLLAVSIVMKKYRRFKKELKEMEEDKKRRRELEEEKERRQWD